MKRLHKLNGNLIFLDIDGVLTSERVHRTIFNKDHYGVWAKFDPIAIDYLNNLYRENDIDFVICSTWRETFDTRAMKHILYSAGFQGAILASTQKNSRSITKAKSIKMFVEEHKPKNWLVLDDDCVGAGGGRNWENEVYVSDETPQFFVPKVTAIKTDTFNGLDCFAMEECSKAVAKWKCKI